MQRDEIWSFCGMKGKTARAKGQDRPDGVGDVWTWTAIDADSKLIIGWLVGGRDASYAHEFMNDIASRLANRVQLTTDGHGAHLMAVLDAFGHEVDYAQLVKVYGPDPREDQRSYLPAACLGAEKHRAIGNPAEEHVSTSHIERTNLTLRMANRRFTRLTNAFSRKLESHCHMIALYTVWYNFVKMHRSLKMTPALAVNVSDTFWSIEDLVALVDKYDEAQPRQKPGRKPKENYPMARKPPLGDSLRVVRSILGPDGKIAAPAETVAKIAAQSENIFAIRLPDGIVIHRVPIDALEFATAPESN